MTKDQVKKVASLANLPVTEQEEELYSKQLSEILDYIDKIEDAAATKEVKPTFNVSMNTNITRPDKVSINLTQEEALSNGSSKGGQFVTRGVFENE